MIATLLMACWPAPFLLQAEEKPERPEYGEQVRRISTALAEYHQTRGTDTAPYPSDIHQLDAIGITDNIRELLSVRKADAGHWLYFWSADAENPDSPLLISPPFSDPPMHLLLTTGGTVTVVKSEAAAEAVRASPEPPNKVPAPVKE